MEQIFPERNTSARRKGGEQKEKSMTTVGVVLIAKKFRGIEN